MLTQGTQYRHLAEKCLSQLGGLAPGPQDGYAAVDERQRLRRPSAPCE